MNLTNVIETLINLAWDRDIPDETRDSMVSHFIYAPAQDWDIIKHSIIYSDSVGRIIETIDTLRDISSALNES